MVELDVGIDPYDEDMGLNINVNNSLTIPLKSKSTKSSFETRVPTRYELDNYEHIDMCSIVPWDPWSIGLQELSECIPEKIQMSDDSYAYLDPEDKAVILHSMDGSSINMKEKILFNVNINMTKISSTMYDTSIGIDKADRSTLIPEDRHERVSKDLGLVLKQPGKLSDAPIREEQGQLSSHSPGDIKLI